MVNCAALGFGHLIAIDYENLYGIIKTFYDIKMHVSVNHKKTYNAQHRLIVVSYHFE